MTRMTLILVLASTVAACGDDSGPPSEGEDTGTSSTTASCSATTASSSSASDTASATMETTGTTADSEDTQSEGCATRNVCLPVAAGEFTGPVTAHLVAPDAEPTQCPEGWTESEDGLFEIVVPQFDCQCSCADPPTGASCAFEIEFNTGGMCNGGVVQTSPATEGECISYDMTNAQSVRISDTVETGTCGTGTFAPPMPSSWERRIDLCTAPAGEGTCADGECVPLPPAPFVGRMCLVAEGDVECPDGPYSVPYVVHEGVEDTRGCDCTCEPDIGCEATLQAFGESDCTISQGTSDGSCIDFINTPNGARLSSVTMEPQCRGVAGKNTGEVTPTGVRTLCCTDD